MKVWTDRVSSLLERPFESPKGPHARHFPKGTKILGLTTQDWFDSDKIPVFVLAGDGYNPKTGDICYIGVHLAEDGDEIFEGYRYLNSVWVVQGDATWQIHLFVTDADVAPPETEADRLLKSLRPT